MQSWFTIVSPFMTRFRKARARKIRHFFPDINTRSIVDLGGSLHFWNSVQKHINPRRITIYNIALDNQFDAAKSGDQAGNIQSRVYDGKSIPADDKQIDLLLCNSVIEHVPPSERAGLAREIQRVTNNYIVQTPARVFPLEPHFLMPFLHWLPKRLGREMVRLSPFGLLHRDKHLTQTFFDEIDLLSAADLRRLFPEGKLIVERFLFMPKSYLIIHKA